MELLDFVNLIWRKKFQIIIFTLLFVFVVILANLIKHPTYQSSTILKISVTPLSFATYSSRETRMSINKEFTVYPKTGRFAQKVIDKLGLKISAAQLVDRINASVDPETLLVTILVKDEKPKQAQKIADTIGKILSEKSTFEDDLGKQMIKLFDKRLKIALDEIEKLSQQQETLKNQLDILQNSASSDQEKKKLELSLNIKLIQNDISSFMGEYTRINMLKFQEKYYEEIFVSIVDPAIEPIYPIEPNTERNIFLALFGGFLFNVSMITFSELIKQRSKKYKEEISVLQYIGADELGGVTKHIVLLSRGLIDKGWHIVLMCPETEALLPFKNEMENLGVKIVSYRQDSIFLWSTLVKTIKVWRVIKDYDINLVHVHREHALAGRSALLGGSLAGIPVITTEHFPLITSFRLKSHSLSLLKCWYVKIVKKIELILYEKAIAVSEANFRYLNETIGTPKRRLRRIYNGIDMSIFSAKRNRSEILQKFGLQADLKIMGTVAALVKPKGHVYLLDAAVKVIQEYPKVAFLIVGDGPLRDELKMKCDELGISERVIFCGYQDNIPDIMFAIDIFVLPSIYEPFGLVLVEAMASAKPIIATNVDGVPEIVTDGFTGLLVPPKNSEELALAILKCLNDRNLAKKLSNQAVLEAKRFSFEEMVSQIHELYQEELNRIGLDTVERDICV